MKRFRHDSLVPYTGVCNLCRGVAGIDSRTTHKHHTQGRLIKPYFVLEICELCHYYTHAIEGTGANNAPQDPQYAYQTWLELKNGGWCWWDRGDN